MIRINLLPTKAARKKESVIHQLVMGAIVLALALIGIYFVHMQKKNELSAQRVENNRLEEEIRQLASIIAQVEDYKKKKQDRNSKIEVIKKLNQGRSGPVKMLDEFTYTLPEKLWVKSWREKAKRVELQGVALSGTTIADFIDNLRSSKYFNNVELIQTQLQVKNKLKLQQFRIDLVVDYIPD